MYFVHSLHGVPDDPAVVAATCDYGGPVDAAVERGNVCATQFHPEKSGARRPRTCWPTSSPLVAAAAARMIELYPAIDLRGGRCVRLYQGDYDRETVYGDDPVAVARRLRRRRGAAGSTSSTSTPPAPASR